MKNKRIVLLICIIMICSMLLCFVVDIISNESGQNEQINNSVASGDNGHKIKDLNLSIALGCELRDDHIVIPKYNAMETIDKKKRAMEIAEAFNMDIIESDIELRENNEVYCHDDNWEVLVGRFFFRIKKYEGISDIKGGVSETLSENEPNNSLETNIYNESVIRERRKIIIDKLDMGDLDNWNEDWCYENGNVTVSLASEDRYFEGEEYNTGSCIFSYKRDELILVESNVIHWEAIGEQEIISEYEAYLALPEQSLIVIPDYKDITVTECYLFIENGIPVWIFGIQEDDKMKIGVRAN